MMCNRLSFAVSRSIQTTLRKNHYIYSQIPRSFSVFARKQNTVPVLNQSYVINCNKYNSAVDRVMGPNYSTDETQIVIPIVSYEVVKDLPNHPGEVVLIDVREPEELQETGTIPTAFNIPLNEVSTALNLSDRQFKTKYNREKPNFDDEIIFHCRSGKRSEIAAIAATKIGYTNVKNYLGSWLEWAEREGLPT